MLPPAQVGPSPRAWGLRPRTGHLHRQNRAIPTCVGTTSWRSRCAEAPRAIPTCVGTTPILPLSSLDTRGPSPRAWGLRSRAASCSGEGGPSPRAWGLLRASRGFPSTSSGHPHVRGDYALEDSLIWGESGPSPRAWGLQVCVARGLRGYRAIPTCVGTTLDQDGKNTFLPPVMCLFGR